MSSLEDTRPVKASVAHRWALAFTVVGLIICAAALFGILTRPVGFLAAFWPANAVLLGLMVRKPEFATPAGWIGALCGYMAADLVTGGEVFITFWLTAANLTGAITGVLLFRVLEEDDRQLRRPQAVLFMFAICVVAAAASALVGGGAARLLFDRDFLTGLEFWFTTELVNSLLILPPILAFPDLAGPAPRRQFLKLVRRANVWTVGPLVAVVASALGEMAVGGPGALAFALPALLWCALTYSVFATAVISLAFCSALLMGVSVGLVQVPMTGDLLSSMSSFRLGVAIVALGPLTVASVDAARNELVTKLSHLVNHDVLTGVMSRGAFLARGSQLVAQCRAEGRPVCALMMDIDHFKSVNDRFGHSTGDRVIAHFAATVAEQLGEGALLGRLGGEEFSALLPDVTIAEAVAVAERARKAIEAASQSDALGVLPDISASFGVCDGSGRADLAHMLAAADNALYVAKSAGRNRVVAATVGATPPVAPKRRRHRA